MKILVSEVGLRDGLQSVDSVMPTPAKLAWIAAEAAAGVREIELRKLVAAALPSEALHGFTVLAGLPLGFHDSGRAA